MNTATGGTARPSVRRGARIRDHALALALCLIVMQVPVWSQTPKRPAASKAPAASTAPKASPAPQTHAPAASVLPPASVYRYNPAGRRDPFVSLLDTGETAQKTGKAVQGLSGLTADDLVVKGVLQSGHEYVAMVQGPDGKTYLAHVNDRLADGKITSITLSEVVIEQNINNPLSLVKQRVIRKTVGARTK